MTEESKFDDDVLERIACALQQRVAVAIETLQVEQNNSQHLQRIAVALERIAGDLSDVATDFDLGVRTLKELVEVLTPVKPQLKRLLLLFGTTQ